MTKTELFKQWVDMVESGELEVPGLKHCSLEHRDALYAAFWCGLEAANHCSNLLGDTSLAGPKNHDKGSN